MPTCLVTGASGRLGRLAIDALSGAGWTVLAGTRDGAGGRALGDLAEPDDAILDRACAGVDVVLHLAAVAHREARPDLIEAVNLRGAAALSGAARRAGVASFVFASSIYAASAPGRASPFPAATDDPPFGPYGRAKREAETLLAADWGARLTVLRFAPILIAPAAGSLGRLLRLSATPFSSLLGGVDNARSMASPGTAVRACLAACQSGGAGIVPVADGTPISTASLVACFRQARGLGAAALPLPRRLVRAVAAGVLGEDGAAALCDDFVVATDALAALGVRPEPDSLAAARAYAS